MPITGSWLVSLRRCSGCDGKVSKAGEESGFQLPQWHQTDSYMYSGEKTKPRTGKVAGITENNICLRLFRM